jgi:cytochrome oxidase Cu insertion factor (SCO1/SenC/PrrC family)
VTPSGTAKDLGALVDALRTKPDGADQLAALLPENLPLYAGRSGAETTRFRGYLLAAFADTGLPDAALPYVVESLEAGHGPDEVAGAAIGLRGLGTAPVDVATPLLRAIENLAGADVTVSLEAYRPTWPYARPTTALTEVVRTIGLLGERAQPAVARLADLAGQRDRFPAALRDEMQRVVAAAAADSGCCGSGTCACCAPPVQPAAPLPDDVPTATVLEDQDGRTTAFDEFFTGRPAVVAFFYTRCDNPRKCSLTVTKLAALQRSIEEGGQDGAVRIAAITYDPAFDLPHRLRLYGADRGIRFGEHVRFFRAPSRFDDVRRHFDLGVNYGAATVNRHRTELFVLDAKGRVAAGFTRVQWDVDAVLGVLDGLAGPDGLARSQPDHG